MQVIAQGARESRRGADAEHIDAARLQQGLHRAGEGLAVQMLVRMAQPVHIRLQDRRDDVLLAEAFIRDLNALHGGQAVEHHFLQRALHGGIAVIAQLRRKAHDRRLGHLRDLAERARRQEAALS